MFLGIPICLGQIGNQLFQGILICLGTIWYQLFQSIPICLNTIGYQLFLGIPIFLGYQLFLVIPVCLGQIGNQLFLGILMYVCTIGYQLFLCMPICLGTILFQLFLCILICICATYALTATPSVFSQCQIFKDKNRKEAKKKMLFSSKASTQIINLWIRTGSQPYWKSFFNLIVFHFYLINLYMEIRT